MAGGTPTSAFRDPTTSKAAWHQRLTALLAPGCVFECEIAIPKTNFTSGTSGSGTHMCMLLTRYMYPTADTEGDVVSALTYNMNHETREMEHLGLLHATAA